MATADVAPHACWKFSRLRGVDSWAQGHYAPSQSPVMLLLTRKWVPPHTVHIMITGLCLRSDYSRVHPCQADIAHRRTWMGMVEKQALGSLQH